MFFAVIGQLAKIESDGALLEIGSQTYKEWPSEGESDLHRFTERTPEIAEPILNDERAPQLTVSHAIRGKW